jgi:hypothetical protein
MGVPLQVEHESSIAGSRPRLLKRDQRACTTCRAVEGSHRSSRNDASINVSIVAHIGRPLPHRTTTHAAIPGPAWRGAVPVAIALFTPPMGCTLFIKAF